MPYNEIVPRTSFKKKKNFNPSRTRQFNILTSDEGNAHNLVSETINKNSNPSGFYLLPFIGLVYSENLIGEFNAIEVQIEEGMGTSYGLSIGYEWTNFFSDIHISYQQNRMKSTSLPLWLKPLLTTVPSFSGESKGWGVHVSGGGRIHLNQFISFSLGAGIGGVDQDTSFSLAGIPVEEKDFLFSYQVFSGLEFRPVESTSIGLRYRWLNIDKMDFFSNRDLHLLELYLGYLF
ncbi:MAG: hypothetical protein P8P49_04215 [Opitutales bacterium]|nr:hypothetical protein [Opitutales bacterium]